MRRPAAGKRQGHHGKGHKQEGTGEERDGATGRLTRAPRIRCVFAAHPLSPLRTAAQTRRHFPRTHRRASSRAHLQLTSAMPKNTKGKGGKNRRRGKHGADGEKAELTIKEEGQEYAQVCNSHATHAQSERRDGGRASSRGTVTECAKSSRGVMDSGVRPAATTPSRTALPPRPRVTARTSHFHLLGVATRKRSNSEWHPSSAMVRQSGGGGARTTRAVLTQ
jgi:hypothetical protein